MLGLSHCFLGYKYFGEIKVSCSKILHGGSGFDALPPRTPDFFIVLFLDHPSRRLEGELIVQPWSGVRPSSTISNMNLSSTSGPITMKFYQKHHWDRGKAAVGFGPDWIKTLVSMETDSSHRVIMEKTVLSLSQPFLIRSFYTCR